MRIAIFGTGGAGGYFGGKLAKGGEDVVFIARGEHGRAIRENGLHIDSVDGPFMVEPARVTDDPAQAGPADVVLVGVKAWQVSEAADAMRPLVGPETFVVPLQNGVEAPSQLAAVLGEEHVLGALAKVFSFIVAPGRIRHLGGPSQITFGELDNRRSDRAERLREVLTRAGIAAEIPPDIHAALWEKFLFIVPLGGVGAVTRVPLGVTRTLPETRGMLMQGMREIEAVARARNLPLPHDIVARTMAFVDTLPPDGTFSMQRDIAAGRPSELEAWNGAVVRLGRQAGVATPLHEFLYHSLLPLEISARGKVARK
ncbi:MAG: 2-dehydropantoate 2-reductase [Deltaproteobacteria bacterium]|nr:2-dehydropantoate 2-reductase [Deltaproteobacteria bacterium]PWB65778.1 MAG: 2-dehydropantoate 2-reductase [Deltaproteobacteria bacterium]